MAHTASIPPKAIARSAIIFTRSLTPARPAGPGWIQVVPPAQFFRNWAGSEVEVLHSLGLAKRLSQENRQSRVSVSWKKNFIELQCYSWDNSNKSIRTRDSDESYRAIREGLECFFHLLFISFCCQEVVANIEGDSHDNEREYHFDQYFFSIRYESFHIPISCIFDKSTIGIDSCAFEGEDVNGEKCNDEIQ